MDELSLELKDFKIMLGDKNETRKQVFKIGVPLIPGSKDVITNVKEGKKVASEIGYPIMIKASIGGGGKGMRIVSCEESFEELYHTAKSEAQVSFKDDRVYIEKFIVEPKHIEVQLIGDKYENVIHLYERIVHCKEKTKNF